MRYEIRFTALIAALLIALAGPARLAAGGSVEAQDDGADKRTGMPSERGGSLERGNIEPPEGYERAIFAGGCFWCMEPPYDEVDGVYAVTSGFTGGETVDPTYEEVIAGGTGHQEAVEVIYDPRMVGYRELIDIFWRNIDPLDDRGQFCDRGDIYRSGIFYVDDGQREIAEDSRSELEASGRFDREIVTEIRQFDTFYPAEEYHQAYYLKNPVRYRFYRTSCGRDNRLQQLWSRLDGKPERYEVT